MSKKISKKKFKKAVKSMTLKAPKDLAPSEAFPWIEGYYRCGSDILLLITYSTETTRKISVKKLIRTIINNNGSYTNIPKDWPLLDRIKWLEGYVQAEHDIIDIVNDMSGFNYNYNGQRVK